jgi:alkylation response protein AidB-like acyl-CoA dehydrogenase
MRFLLDAEQRAFANSLNTLLSAGDTPSVARDWSRGEHTSGRALWRRIAEAGVFALAVPEAYEGVGPRPVELAVAFVELGRHAVPGPLVESVTAAALLADLPDPGPAKRLLPQLATGEAMATLAWTPPLAPLPATDAPTTRAARPPATAQSPATRPIPRPPAATGTTTSPAPPPATTGSTASTTTGPTPPSATTPATASTTGTAVPADTTSTAAKPAPPGPYALDGDAAATRLALTPDGLYLSPGHGPVRPCLDPARRLTPLTPGGELLSAAPPTARALTWARLATAAQALGVGLALLDRTVAYVKQRTQFGAPIGSFRAVKHRIADARIALEFARPLLFGASLTMAPEDVAAAKVTACEAAYTTARTALQLHGAIGYTAEYDLSLWLTKARVLRTAWGTPRECRAMVVSGDRRW